MSAQYSETGGWRPHAERHVGIWPTPGDVAWACPAGLSGVDGGDVTVDEVLREATSQAVAPADAMLIVT
jgi:hypothetical protein